eukprot:499253-Pleurochrysis_carterae.AAC.1
MSECVGNTLRWKLPGENNLISNREIPLAKSYFMNRENKFKFGNIMKHQLHWHARKLPLRLKGMQPHCSTCPQRLPLRGCSLLGFKQ